jgi:hypothetical protein
MGFSGITLMTYYIRGPSDTTNWSDINQSDIDPIMI